MQLAILILSLIATLVVPVILLKYARRMNIWLVVFLVMGWVSLVILDMFLATELIPGSVEVFFGYFQIVLFGAGAGSLWFLGFRNMLRLIGPTFWLWFAGALVLGSILGILCRNVPLLDELAGRSELFGELVRYMLGASADAAIENTVMRAVSFALIMLGMLAGVGLGFGGKGADSRKNPG